MHKKMKYTALAVLILAIGIMSLRLIITVFPQTPAKVDLQEGLSYLSIQESADAKEEENAIREETTQPPAPESTAPVNAADNTTQAPAPTTAAPPATIENGNFKAAYKDILISGDSLVKAIYEYNILDTSQVIAEIGAGAKYLESVTDDIIDANPKYLVLHYGENDLDEKDNAVYFINRYKACIQKLQQALPNTKIYVDSIFPVLEKAYKSEPYTVNIDYYNTLLQQMAAELQVTYLDFTPLWASAQKEYHDADGIHPTADFYKELYLPYVYAEVMK